MHVHAHAHIINTTRSLVDGSLLSPPPSPASHLSSHLILVPVMALVPGF